MVLPRMRGCAIFVLTGAMACLTFVTGCERFYDFVPVPGVAPPGVTSTIDAAWRTETQSADGVFVLAESHSLNFAQSFAILVANGTDDTLVMEREGAEIESPGFIGTKTLPGNHFLIVAGIYEGLNCRPGFLEEAHKQARAGRRRAEYKRNAKRAIIAPGQTALCYLSGGPWKKLPRKGDEVVLELALTSEDTSSEPLRFRFKFKRR